MVGSLTSKRKIYRARRSENASGRVPNRPKAKKPKRKKNQIGVQVRDLKTRRLDDQSIQKSQGNIRTNADRKRY